MIKSNAGLKYNMVISGSNTANEPDCWFFRHGFLFVRQVSLHHHHIIIGSHHILADFSKSEFKSNCQIHSNKISNFSSLFKWQNQLNFTLFIIQIPLNNHFANFTTPYGDIRTGLTLRHGWTAGRSVRSVNIYTGREIIKFKWSVATYIRDKPGALASARNSDQSVR